MKKKVAKKKSVRNKKPQLVLAKEKKKPDPKSRSRTKVTAYCLECKGNNSVFDSTDEFKVHLKKVHRATVSTKTPLYIENTSHVDGAEYFTWHREGYITAEDGRKIRMAVITVTKRSNDDMMRFA